MSEPLGYLQSDLEERLKWAQERGQQHVELLIWLKPQGSNTLPVYAPPRNSTEALQELSYTMDPADPMRWEVGFRNIVAILYGPRHAFEVRDVVEDIRKAVDLESRRLRPDGT